MTRRGNDNFNNQISNPFESSSENLIMTENKQSTNVLDDFTIGIVDSNQPNMPQTPQTPPTTKPLYKRTWFIILCLLIFPPAGIVLTWFTDWNKGVKIIITIICTLWFIGILGNTNDDTNTTPSDTNNVTQEESVQTENTQNMENKEENKESVKEKEVIKLVAGEPGEYGKAVTLDEGTEFEEHLILYYVPSGDYEVKNIGDRLAQVNAYEGYVYNEEEGFTEALDGANIIMLKPNETGTINVPEGWFIEIHEPTEIELTKK